jgi:3-(3-hydroxy-phenyl)propionate hydroxylase
MAEMVDVAIVGTGPVGAVAANLCGVHGLSAVAFDRAADVYELPRAAVLYDDVQRILHDAGVLDAVLPATCEVAGAEFVDASGRRIIGLELPPGLRTPNGYPPLLGIDQPRLERAVRSCLARHERVELRVAHEVLGFEQNDEHVELVVRDLNGGEDHRVHARWLVGADGANSAVRKSCGIAWTSLGYDREWLVVDVELRREVELPRLCQQICDPERPITVIPLPGKLRRWEFQLKPGETRTEMEDRERVWTLLAPWLAREDGEILRAVVYRFHATIAETFRRGRVFLAGDAAHQTPPFMGQGLCTGVRDVANLIWKLAMVRRGQGGEALLETYSAERHPLAVAMVEHSTNTGKLIDAYAEMARGGPEPSPELREYAYGGSRRLPDLLAGLLAPGGGEWVGQLLPAAAVSTPRAAGSLDDVVGPRWAIVARADPRPQLSARTLRFWNDRDAAFVAVPEPEGEMDRLLRAHEVVLVRPDRIIYGTVPASGLDALTQSLRPFLTMGDLDPLSPQRSQGEGSGEGRRSEGRTETMAARTPEDCDRLFGEYVNSGDLDSLVTLYEPEASLVGQDGSVATGHAAIREVLGGLIAMRAKIRMNVVKVVRAGEDLAVLYNEWSLSAPRPDGPPMEMAAKAIEVVRRQPDGTWQFAVDDPFVRG